MPHPDPRTALFRGDFAAATLALGLFAGPGRAALADLSPATSTSCWEAVEQHKATASERWTADDSAGALDSRLTALQQAVTCADGTPEQHNGVQTIFENVFFQIAQGATLTRERADDLHRWYLAAERRFGRMSPEAAEGYSEFSQQMPPPVPEPPVPERPEPPVPEPPVPEPSKGVVKSQPPPNPVAVKAQPHRGMIIGGGVLLAAGVGAIGAGLGLLGSTLAAQGKLNDLCSPTCPDNDQRSELIRQGEMHEALTPALIATGAAASVAGGVLLGLGVRRRNTGRFAPVLHSRFVGASWALQF